MKKIIVSVSFLLTIGTITSCGDMQSVMNNLPVKDILGQLAGGDVSNGLKEALNFGVSDGVKLLSAKDGFLKNEAVKILLPKELKDVDKGLRAIGLGNLSDQGLVLLNRAAEDAAVEAAPIFKNAITNMSFTDATKILTGNNNAATEYLRSTTSQELVTAFSPKIQTSLSKVGADKAWEQIIGRYNAIPFVKKVNPNITQYVTEQAVNGVFTMVAQKEKGIRTDVSQRSTDLLKKVFAMQDKK